MKLLKTFAEVFETLNLKNIGTKISKLISDYEDEGETTIIEEYTPVAENFGDEDLHRSSSSLLPPKRRSFHSKKMFKFTDQVNVTTLDAT